MKLTNIYLLIILGIILVLPLSLTQMSDTELQELIQQSIDSGDWETVSTLPLSEQKRILEDPSINRGQVFSGIAKHALKKRKAEGLSLFDFGKVASINSQVNEMRFSGFESSKLEFIDRNTLSDGSITIKLDDLPKSTTEVTYTEGEGIKLELEDSSTIDYATGQVDEDLRYTSGQIPSSTEDNGAIQLKPNKGSISISKDGKFSLIGGSQVSVGDRSFERLDTSTDTESSFSIDPVGGQFKGKGIRLTTNAAEIRINSDQETEILFNRKKPTTEQYIQLVGVEEDTKNLRIKGNDIEIDLLDQGPKIKKITTIADGKNIRIKNGNDKITIFDGSVNYPRIPKGNTIVFNELNPPKFSNGKLVSTPNGPTFVEFDKSNRVCIGSFCSRFGFGISNANPIGEGLGVHISDTRVYALQSEVDAFVEIARSNGWTEDQIRRNGFNHFSQLLEETTYQRAITEDEASDTFAELRTGLESGGVRGAELDKVDTIKREIFSRGPMIVGSVQTTVTFDDGGQKSFGRITYKDKGETGTSTELRVSPITIPGSYLHKYQQSAYGNLDEFPRGLSELVEIVAKSK